jgi:hypothetical protein
MIRQQLAVCAIVALILSLNAPAAPAQPSTDATQVISLAASVAAKELGTHATVHVTKLSLTSNYAIAQWTWGERTGVDIFQKRLSVGWVPLGKGGGQMTTGWLVDYGIPAATATALIAGIEHCANPVHVILHGSVTSVCYIGPCGVC